MLQYSGNLFYHIQILIHHLQVIQHGHLSCTNSIIKTLQPMKTRPFFTNTDDIHSCVTPREKNYSVQATYKTTHLTPLNSALHIESIELHTTNKLPPAGKEYFCFQINGKYYYAVQCVKSRIMNNSVDSILSIDTFEKQYVVIKGMLQSPYIEDHMNNIQNPKDDIDTSVVSTP